MLVTLGERGWRNTVNGLLISFLKGRHVPGEDLNRLVEKQQSDPIVPLMWVCEVLTALVVAREPECRLGRGRGG